MDDDSQEQVPVDPRPFAFQLPGGKRNNIIIYSACLTSNQYVSAFRIGFQSNSDI